MLIRPETLADIRRRYQEATAELSKPETAQDLKRLADLGREVSELRDTVAVIDRYEGLKQELADLREMAGGDDAEMAELAELELEEKEERLPAAEKEVQQALLPKDAADARPAIVEIRAGTGGDEAALFVEDLLKLYERYAQSKGWKMEMMEAAEGGAGGFKEVILNVKGTDVFGGLKYESGVHRVQRVPATESQGRIHTSAATVAVLPEAEEVDVELHANDLKIDVYRSSGPGGQSVNTTDSAVRITHIPTGIVVAIQDEKSQIKNKAKAMTVLRSRLYQAERDRIESERSAARKDMVGSGDRSGKIRTYNWPQGRVTDHRLDGDDKNHALQNVLAGELGPIIDALRLQETARLMEEAARGEG